MITALEDRHSIERAFAAGASDYISKPLHLSVVNQRVRRVVEVTRAERHVHHLAYNDILTGLPNRLMFTNQVNLAVDRSKARSLSFAILFLDLDRFKFVNDTLGHEVGDYLLQGVATRLKACVRAGDCVARQGGDEFTILLNELPEPAAAGAVAQKICRSLALPFDINTHEIFVNASIGVAIFPSDGSDVSSLLRHADTAMYRAKRSSSRICFYEQNMEEAISGHLKLERDLRHALERNELMVYYQPVARSKDGLVTGVEALVRWQHPKRGLVSPVEFIPMAEETGLIIPLGEQVLKMACAQVKAWRDASGSDLHVAVNLSARQLEKADLVETVEQVLHDTGLPPSALMLEITESVLMEHARDTIVTLHRLRGLGVRLAIDDFGTGYSSLGYLKRFPTDTLKVDRSFVQDMIHDQDAGAIVTGIIALAHSLRLMVIAEGVETVDQRDALIALGCDYLQGYLLSQPVPPAEFEANLLALAKA
jgi:diguanylate cyclase (GGDEF)-like protein